MDEEWEIRQQKHLQESMLDSLAYMLERYAFDISNVMVTVKSLETTIPEGYDPIPNHRMSLIQGDRALITLEFTRVSKEFENKLWGPETDYTPYGEAKIINKVEIHPDLSENDIKVISHIVALLIRYGLVLLRVEELNRQPLAFQEIWKMMWGVGKPVEEGGVQFLRYDDPIGWNA